MTLLKGSAFIYATSNVEALDSVSKARGMAHQVPKSFFKLNGRELTAQNRQYKSTVNTKSKTVVLASGNSRRYHIRSPRIFSLSYTYLPGPDAMTVDGKAARDYLYTIAGTGKNASIEYLPDYTADQSDFDYKTARVVVKGYKESIIRRDEVGGCYYYNLSIQFEEL
jgi:hypothetical protein